MIFWLLGFMADVMTIAFWVGLIAGFWNHWLWLIPIIAAVYSVLLLAYAFKKQNDEEDPY